MGAEGAAAATSGGRREARFPRAAPPSGRPVSASSPDPASPLARTPPGGGGEPGAWRRGASLTSEVKLVDVLQGLVKEVEAPQRLPREGERVRRGGVRGSGARVRGATAEPREPKPSPGAEPWPRQAPAPDSGARAQEPTPSGAPTGTGIPGPAGGPRGPEGRVWPRETSRGPHTADPCEALAGPPHWLSSAWPSPPSSPLRPRDGMAPPPPRPAACPPRTNRAAAGRPPGARPAAPTQRGTRRGRAGGAAGDTRCQRSPVNLKFTPGDIFTCVCLHVW